MSRGKRAAETRLRRQAGKRLRKKTKRREPARAPKSNAGRRGLLQELETHQIELEQQNEELRRTQSELEAALQRYSDFYDFTPAGYLTLEPDSTIRQANLTVASLVGIERARLLKRRFALFVAADARLAFGALLSSAFESKAVETGEVRLAIKGKPPVTVRLQACVSAGERECRVVLTDITGHKQVEAKLLESEDKFSRLFRLSPDAISLSRLADGAYLDINESFTAITGYTLDEVVGRSAAPGGLGIWVNPQHRERLIAELKARGAVAGFEASFRRKDGEVILGLVSARVLRINGEDCILSISRDITERKRVEAALVQSEEELRHLAGRLLQLQDEERRRVARELHDTVAQDLTALSLNLGLLGSLAAGLDSRSQKLLGDSQALANACANDIRTSSYLLHPPILDELGLAGAMRDHADGFARRSGLRVDLELPPDLARLPRATELALFRVLQEALANIQRHSSSRSASISLIQTSGQIRLEVRDQGHGLIPRSRPAAGARTFPSAASVEHEQGSRASPGSAKHVAADRNVRAPLNTYEAPGMAPGGGAPGVGISGMRERMRQLGGCLEIKSSESGTSVIATLPRTQETGGA